MREHGYVEGHNILLELCYAVGQGKQLPALAMDLVRSKVDVIVAIPNPAVGCQASVECVSASGLKSFAETQP